MSGKVYKKTIKDLSPVLFTPINTDGDIYEVRRDIDHIDNIRYDETTIYPGHIGKEYPKTFGHYHPINNRIGYPEIYSVLEGRAWYLIQKPDPNNLRKIDEVYLIEVLPKQKTIIPPNFGHITINPGGVNLEMANWCGDFENDYTSYENLRGGAYYILQSPDKKNIDFIKNSYYQEVSDLIKVRPKEIPELGITWGNPMIDMKKNPKYLEFLLKPEKYLYLLKPENCFEKI